MSRSRDRLTFFAVLIGVGVAGFGYLRLGAMYPTAGRDHAPDGGGAAAVEDAGHWDDDETHERPDASDPDE